MKKLLILLLLTATLGLALVACADKTDTPVDPSLCVHEYVQEAGEDYLVFAATCQTGATYLSHCKICGALGAPFTDSEKGEHNYLKQKDPAYLVSAATCDESSVYSSVCEHCGALGDTFAGNEYLPHVLVKDPSDATLASVATCRAPEKHFYACKNCGYVAGSGATYNLGPKRDHTDSHGDEICDICKNPMTTYPDDPKIELGTGIHEFKEEN